MKVGVAVVVAVVVVVVASRTIFLFVSMHSSALCALECIVRRG